jgi:hypothetical protein
MEGFKVHSTPDVESVGFVAPSPVATVLPSTPSGKFARRGNGRDGRKNHKHAAPSWHWKPNGYINLLRGAS